MSQRRNIVAESHTVADWQFMNMVKKEISVMERAQREARLRQLAERALPV
jgi:hypothetical protein